MRLSAEDMTDRARWLIGLRWIACTGAVVVVWVSSSILRVVTNPAPLYFIAAATLACNCWLDVRQRRRPRGQTGSDRDLLLQIVLDQVALALLIGFAGLGRNPFICYFVFHPVIASLLLPGLAPYLVAGLASLLIGGLLLIQFLGWSPGELALAGPAAAPGAVYLAGLWLAYASTLWMVTWFSVSLRHYVDRAQAQLRQQQKYIGVGQLVAGIAHQISNPLDGLQNCLNTLEQGVRDDQHLTHYVDLMREALGRIERTAKRVQEFAHPHGLHLQPTDVNAAIESTLHLIDAEHHDRIEIITEFGAVPPARGDAYTLQEVVFHLCSNAIAAIPERGRLTLRTGVRPGRDGRPDDVIVEVADTGEGIPPENLERIFEPFFTTRAQRGGTGLGLGLCRMLVSEMGGWIDVSSAPGEGTTFLISLPSANHQESLASHEDTDR